MPDFEMTADSGPEFTTTTQTTWRNLSILTQVQQAGPCSHLTAGDRDWAVEKMLVICRNLEVFIKNLLSKY